MARAECGFEGRPDELVQYGPTIVVRIGFSPEVSFDSGDRASLPSTQFFALVDTGASESCIDSAVAMELGLPVVDREMVAGVHGAAPANVHLAHIYIPDMDMSGSMVGLPECICKLEDSRIRLSSAGTFCGILRWSMMGRQGL